TVRYGIQADASLKWTGLRFRGMIFTMCLASLLMSGAVFAVFPRVFVGSPVNLGTGSLENPGIINRTGFREQVVLGEFGVLLKSEERVLQLSVFHQPTNRPVDPDEFAGIMEMDELVLRGTSMGHYAKGRWDPGEALQGYFSAEPNRYNLSHRGSVFDCYRVEVTQDPPVGNFAFAPRPVTSAQLINANGRIVERSLTQSLVFDLDREDSWESARSPGLNRQPISYEIYCPAPEASRKINPSILLSDRIRRWAFPHAPSRSWLQKEDHFAKQYAITRGLQESLPDLSRLAAELCQQEDGLLPVQECANRIVSLLRDSGNFRYSLDVPRTTSGMDPAEDFLLNHRTGHCQYFASACALMLQSLNIPARIVNGFKGGDVNPDTKRMLVRQKHAHVWVEYRHQQRWVRIDPTPAARNEFVASTQETPFMGNLKEAASDLWTAGMDNVTAERQREFIQPIIDYVTEIVSDIRSRGLWAALQNRIRSASQWFNWRVFVGGFAGMLLLATLVRRRIRQLIRLLSGFFLDRLSSRRRVASSIVRFYESFCRLCARHGLEFPPSGTATENALSAADFFHDRLDSTTRGIPARIASAFNAVRYGDHLLTEKETTELAQDVARFTQALREAPRQTTQQA
ncbi:MAG: transglutaminaseTgpA domain-containing protein, partial [Fuerstiella sp.]|nr:transglutaminaseTgpA domain-containing protein [Fuerstiella sp.]